MVRVAKSCYFESNGKAIMRISNGTRHQILIMQKELLRTFTNATHQSLGEEANKQLNEQLNKQSNEQANEQSDEQSMKQSKKELKLTHR